MKLTIETDLNRSRAEVWRAFDNPENMKKWQPTLKTFEPQSGVPGQPGAVSKLTYDENGREVVLIETVTSRNAPAEFSGTYAAPGVDNTISNRFVELDQGRTRWIMETEFHFQGWMKLLTPFMKGMLRKRTEANVQLFKKLLETGELT
jgi:uncharacterized protein YndB with AHSA1/START domain